MPRGSVLALGLALCCMPTLARADAMELALSRLRVAAGEPGCERASGTDHCPDNELFERLVAELAVAVAPPVTTPAHGIGVERFFVGLDSTLTSIESDSDHWKLGTEGDGALDGRNASPAPVLAWNRVEVRKGLPLGFEVGSAFGQEIGSSLWSVGGQLRWTPFEGFTSGWGQLPDVAVRGAVATALGSDELGLTVWALDVVCSKPFLLAPGWRAAPLLALQVLQIEAESDVVSLDPGVDAAPSYERFDDVSHWRSRMVVGGQARWAELALALSLGFDLDTPALAAAPTRASSGQPLARQLALSLSLGAIL